MIKFEDVKNITTEEYFKGNEFAINVFKDKYSLTKEDGTKETPAEVWWRVADGLASVEPSEALYTAWRDRWFSDMYETWYLPGGSTIAGIGNSRHVSIFNCTHDLIQEDSLEGIFSCLYRVAKEAATRQGVGIDFSALRPRGANVNNASNRSEGAVKWMHLFDSLAEYIGQSGRRIAQLGSLSCDHPDLIEFLNSKTNQDSLQNMNISVMTSDAFFQACIDNKDWDLVFNDKIFATYPARALLRMIAEKAWKWAEPGIINLDIAKRESPTSYVRNPRTGATYQPTGVNACAEATLPFSSTCVLGSINLGMFSTTWDEFLEELNVKVPRLVRLLDNAILYEHAHKKYATKEQLEVVSDLRSIGCGVSNLHGWLLNQGLSYDSDEAISLVEKFSRQYAYLTHLTSIDLGKERSSFLAFEEDLYKTCPFIKRMMHEFPDLEYKTMRNSTTLSYPPTGSLSIIMKNCISSGIEPVPGFYYWKRARTSGQYKWYFNLVPIVNEYMKNNFGVSWGWETIEDPDGKLGESIIKLIEDKLGNNKSIFKPAHLVDPMKKVQMMSKMAKYVDASISTTYNLPEAATAEVVENIYLEAWKSGVKAVSVYRDRSRQGVIEFEPPHMVEKRFTACADTLRPDKIARRCAPKRPKELPCEIHQITVKGQKWVVPVGLYEGEPFEIFAGKSDVVQIPERLRAGKIVKQAKSKYSLIIPLNDGEIIEIKDMAAVFQNDEQNALTRQISLNLRTGTHLQFIVEQLKKGAGSIVDFSAAIARVLSKYIKPIVTRDEKCPQCGNDSLDSSQGCVKCVSCGWSRCE